MSTQLTDYGWKILKGSVDFQKYGYPEFIEETAIVHGSEDWRDLEVSTNFFHQGVDIGLILRYNSKIGYLCFVVTSNQYKLVRVPILSYGDNITFGDPYIIQIRPNLNQLELNQSYELKAILSGTNIKCYVNNELVINAEDALYNKGAIGVYGDAGAACSNIQANGLIPSTWNIVNKRNGDVVDLNKKLDGNLSLRISTILIDSESIIGISQTIPTEIGKPYTVSFNYTGPEVCVKFGEQLELQSGSNSFVHTFIADSASTEIIIGGMLAGLYDIDDVQVEQKEFKTAYVEGSREDGELTYPAHNNIDTSKGTISLWMIPQINLSGTSDIVYYGDDNANCIRIYHDNTGIVFQYGNSKVSAPLYPLEKGKAYYICAAWDTVMQPYGIRLFAREDKQAGYSFGTGVIEQINISSSVIYIGNSPASTPCNAVIDDLIIYNNALDNQTMLDISNSEEELESSDDMLLRANFNHAIGKFDHSVIELTPPPLPGTPVIVTKESGAVLRKVSFTDPHTNQYTTYNQEPFIYDGGKIIKLSYADIDNKYYRTGIYTKDGYCIRTYDQMEIPTGGNQILLHESLPDEYIGQELIAMYQPKDCYVVDYNPSSSNVCRIILGKNDGSPVVVTYESNQDVGRQRLAETVELNPINSPNHSGFMYITQKPDFAEIFKVYVSPDELIANGYDYSIVIMEVVDRHGNPVSNVNYLITSPPKYGSFTPYFSPDYNEWIKRKGEYLDSGHTEEQWYENYGYYIGLNERAGRQIYIYKPYRLNPISIGSDEAIENIVIKDTVSGLGTDLSIRLILKSDYKL